MVLHSVPELSVGLGMADVLPQVFHVLFFSGCVMCFFSYIINQGMEYEIKIIYMLITLALFGRLFFLAYKPAVADLL
jgi:hypothetical protein